MTNPSVQIRAWYQSLLDWYIRAREWYGAAVAWQIRWGYPSTPPSDLPPRLHLPDALPDMAPDPRLGVATHSAQGEPDASRAAPQSQGDWGPQGRPRRQRE